MLPTRSLPPVCALLLLAPALIAHPGHDSGFADGLVHPLTGLDHLLAMIAVGMLGVRCGGKALWLVPLSFLTAMLVGGLIAATGVNVMGVEPGIALSVLAFGVLVALATPPKTAVACAVVAAFALLHGFAHVAEAGTGHFAGYAGGFLLATAALHAAGIAAAILLVRTSPPAVMRTAGVGIAACGIYLAVTVV